MYIRLVHQKQQTQILAITENKQTDLVFGYSNFKTTVAGWLKDYCTIALQLVPGVTFIYSVAGLAGSTVVS